MSVIKLKYHNKKIGYTLDDVHELFLIAKQKFCIDLEFGAYCDAFRAMGRRII